MQNTTRSKPQSPKPSQSEELTNSPSVRSFGTVEDFEFSSDESLLKWSSLNSLPEVVVAMPRKRSNTLVQQLSPHDDPFPEQEFNHSRNISISSRRTRNSTLTDFDSKCIPSLLFHKYESGEFDFCHQPDRKFSHMMSSNQGNIFEVNSNLEDFSGLEHSDFGEEKESKSMYFMGDTVPENYNQSVFKSDDIDELAVPSGRCALPQGQEHHSPFNSQKIVKSTQEYDTDNEELISSPDYVEQISNVPLCEKNQIFEEKWSEVSTTEGNSGRNSETKSNWIPVRKHYPFQKNREIYKSKKRNSDGVLNNHLKKAITMPRRAQTESWRSSQVGLKFRKLGSLTLTSNLQFCSPCSPEDKRSACIIM